MDVATSNDAADRPSRRSVPSSQAAEARFLRLAFTAADLLVELAADGTVRYAAGAFAARLGASAEQFLGGDISRLIVPADRGVLASAIAQACARGRSAPVLLHLNNRLREPVSFAALAGGDEEHGLSATFGRLPETLAGPERLSGVEAFRAEAAARLQGDGPGSLALIELAGKDAARDGARGGARGGAETATLAGALPASEGTPLVGSLAPGRYGVISVRPIDLEAICGRIEELSLANGERVQAAATQFALAPGKMPAGSALRLALRSFAAGGLPRFRQAGFTQGLDGFLARAAAEREAMQRTISGRRFELHFQPVVGLSDRAVRHYEALLRLMPAAQGRPTSTQDFVTAAEAAGLAEELDAAVLEEALGVLEDAPEAAIAVNVSGLSFQSEDFRARLAALLARRHGRHGRLLVELTETAEIENLAAARLTLALLRDAGIPFCLDDFGAGAAGFRYLREFRADYIKIDGGFLRAARESARERAMLGAMVALAREVGAKVVVEMIESREEEELSRALGADLGQGWLYGRPGRLPGSSLRRLTHDRPAIHDRAAIKEALIIS
ncbi:MAG: EAL domain-containing protein [Acetobacteraceae bacterium]